MNREKRRHPSYRIELVDIVIVIDVFNCFDTAMTTTFRYDVSKRSIEYPTPLVVESIGVYL